MSQDLLGENDPLLRTAVLSCSCYLPHTSWIGVTRLPNKAQCQTRNIVGLDSLDFANKDNVIQSRRERFEKKVQGLSHSDMVVTMSTLFFKQQDIP